MAKLRNGPLVYGFDAYDFDAALNAARSRVEVRKGAHTPGGVATAEQRFWQTSFPTPSAEALRRHGDRYGVEGVAETAAAFGIDLRVKRDRARPKRQRRTSANLKAQVLQLHTRGMVPTAIADVLNVSDRRVKELLRELALEAA
jgi:hypothetical protein